MDGILTILKSYIGASLKENNSKKENSKKNQQVISK